MPIWKYVLHSFLLSFFFTICLSYFSPSFLLVLFVRFFLPFFLNYFCLSFYLALCLSCFFSNSAFLLAVLLSGCLSLLLSYLVCFLFCCVSCCFLPFSFLDYSLLTCFFLSYVLPIFPSCCLVFCYPSCSISFSFLFLCGSSVARCSFRSLVCIANRKAQLPQQCRRFPVLCGVV